MGSPLSPKLTRSPQASTKVERPTTRKQTRGTAPLRKSAFVTGRKDASSESESDGEVCCHQQICTNIYCFFVFVFLKDISGIHRIIPINIVSLTFIIVLFRMGLVRVLARRRRALNIEQSSLGQRIHPWRTGPALSQAATARGTSLASWRGTSLTTPVQPTTTQQRRLAGRW